MAKVHPFIVYGASGTGKSTSFYPIPEFNITGVPLEKLFVINCAGAGKIAPVRGKAAAAMFEHSNQVSETGTHWFNAKLLKFAGTTLKIVLETRADIAVILVDDIGVLAGKEATSSETKMDFEDWRLLGGRIQELLNVCMNTKVTRDVYVFLTFHPAVDNITGKTKVFIPGGMVEKYIGGVEGQFVTVFETLTRIKEDGSDELEYLFRTQANNATSKSLPGMFPALMPNDIAKVIQAYAAYFN